MMTKKDTRSRVCYNDVDDIHIRYDIEQETGKPATIVRAFIERDEKRLGSVSAEADGKLYLSFDCPNGIPYAQKREVVSAVLADIDGVFNEPAGEPA